MPHKLDHGTEQFESAFQALLGAKREASQDVETTVRAIITDIAQNGDEALLAHTKRLDRVDLARDELRISPPQISAAFEQTDARVIEALEFAARRIEAHHLEQKPQDIRYQDHLGVELGQKWTAVAAAGIYVPGGTASYPSSVLMNAIPAKVAGVPRIAMVVPTPDGDLNPAVLVAARIAGITEIYRVGGAQAIAALAYGTDSIRPVDKIVGPGNAYVAAAKRMVFGKVGIDMIAGPTEVVILADRHNNPAWIAADLLAQAEHDSSAQSILITDDADFAHQVNAEVLRQLARLPRREIAQASWEEHGAIILVNDINDSLTVAALIDRIAPEHLEIALEKPDMMVASIRNAGAIFIGAHTPEAIGDYVAGTNHVLPTARSARFSSGLGVLDFMKRTSLVRCSADSLKALAPAAIALGQAEQLSGHAASVAVRVHGEQEVDKVRAGHIPASSKPAAA